MAPVKFDDLHKPASDLLSDDFQTSGFEFKAKQKSSFDGAVFTVTTNLVDSSSGGCATPAKLSVKSPTPFKIPCMSVDKLEVDKAGKMKLEMSTDRVLKGMKNELKSDLVDPMNSVIGITYTGLADTQVKAEGMLGGTPTVELTRTVCPPATVGVKFVGLGGLTSPDLGVRFSQGPLFGSLFVRQAFSTYTAHASYKASDEIKCAATYEHGGKKNGQFAVGVCYAATKDVTVKAKYTHDNTVHVGVKNNVSKGFVVNVGGKFNAGSGDWTVGASASIE